MEYNNDYEVKLAQISALQGSTADVHDIYTADLEILKKLEEGGGGGGGGAHIDDTSTSTTKVWSSYKTSSEVENCTKYQILTQAEYDALTTKVGNKLYFIDDGSGNIEKCFFGNYKVSESVIGKYLSSYYNKSEMDGILLNYTQFEHMTQAAYDALETKENNKLYFIFTAGVGVDKIYLGEEDFTDTVFTHYLADYYNKHETDEAIQQGVTGLASTTYVDNAVAQGVTGKYEMKTGVTINEGEVDVEGYGQHTKLQGHQIELIEYTNNFAIKSSGDIIYNDGSTTTQAHVKDIIEATLGYTGKQDQLVSGTNIKTVNGQTLLGSGDLTVGNVQSSYIDTIWKGTQAEYDAIVTKSNTTFYIITGTTN